MYHDQKEVKVISYLILRGDMSICLSRELYQTVVCRVQNTQCPSADYSLATLATFETTSICMGLYLPL
jgi:hypothetical protein